MSPFRIVLRWVLTLLAMGLVLLALLVCGLRFAADRTDTLRDDISAMLARQFNATMRVETIEGDVRGLDPVLTIDELQLTGQAGVDSVPLLDIERVDLRLDTSASLRAWFPIFSRARVREATLHLYQQSDGSWHWPQPAELPPELVPESQFDLKRLDFWIGVLLRQRAMVDELRLVLHGIDDDVTLVAPRILMVGTPERAHVEGRLFIEGADEHALRAVLEITPGAGGADDFDARLQAHVNLDSLARLSRLLTERLPVKVADVSGEAEIWGRWHRGQLVDARARLSIPGLKLSSADGPLVLTDVGARGQWLRGEQDTWQAWINDLSLHSEAIPTSPLPERLYFEGDERGWQARSTPIDLAVVTAWSQQLPLPESLRQTLGTLAPQGSIEGLSMGRRHGQWQARAALQDVAVSPWHEIPGGGPLDAWVEVHGRQGHVRFVGQSGMQLAFPEIYAAPMILDWASGEVSWALDDTRDAFSVTGERLKAIWRGAQVEGGFRFASASGAATAGSGHDESGKFALNLDMRDVNAIDTPLMDWLPVNVLDEELRKWLAGGIAGRVPHGSLHFEQTLDGDDDSAADESGEANEANGATEGESEQDEFDGELRLALEIEDGTLTYDPEWPALERVSGRLELNNETLHATVDHAETLGLASEGTEVALENDVLDIAGPVQGPTQGLLRFLAAAPIDGMDTFAQWQSEGTVAGQLAVVVPMDDAEALEVDVQASVDAPSLLFSQLDLTLGNVNGALHYRHAQDTDFLTGELGARAFDGPLLARFDVGGEGISFEGRALARGLLQWAGMTQLDGLLNGYFPYSAQLDLEGEEPQLSVDSDLQGLAISLPPPFGKRLDEKVALRIDATPGQQLAVELSDRLRLRWRSLGPAAGQGQGQIWLERWPESAQWPGDRGWIVTWRTPRLYLGRWKSTLAALGESPGNSAAAASPGLIAQPGAALPELQRVSISTDCLHFRQRCLGSLEANASPLVDGWQLALAGTLVQGQASYRPGLEIPLDIDLARLNLDTLMPETTQMPELAEAIATAPEPTALPGWLDKVPDGEITIDTLLHQGRRLGPLLANWQASSQRLRVAPLALTLGEVTAAGELVWEASGPQASLTRSRLSLTGGDLGSALAALDQPVAIRSATTRIDSQLAWPGTPWQFALERSRGSIEAALDDGRFVTLDSPSARLIGLLNVDNLLRRLRLDFSDVTGEGTAFDSVRGEATLYGGRLETRGPVEIDGPSTQFTLNGSVDLAARRLDMLLGITVPVSQNLPLAAVLVGAPYVGGALFLADKLFGGWLDKVTRIHYRVQGPWTSPQITLEDAE
nr:AsmA-like C-terminal region-containing protein [uncultured Halomonas sp.]